ncbi:hypothetical protein GSI_12405 [Ganoderma sinense ZZ0214-1]|uniref:Uncharacterized protein n=1 Tax=Ganoderma sinense ZZ0214-1 TaxID=1077348 RepID=A0A2G8RVJ2_9APHY|nr:hypothetical protein GSI_12405 [Ganoderma sinense ZZ0214-1]
MALQGIQLVGEVWMKNQDESMGGIPTYTIACATSKRSEDTNHLGFVQRCFQMPSQRAIQSRGHLQWAGTRAMTRAGTRVTMPAQVQSGTATSRTRRGCAPARCTTQCQSTAGLSHAGRSSDGPLRLGPSSPKPSQSGPSSLRPSQLGPSSPEIDDLLDRARRISLDTLDLRIRLRHTNDRVCNLNLTIMENTAKVEALAERLIGLRAQVDQREHDAAAFRGHVNKRIDMIELGLKAIMDHLGIPAPAK